MKNLKEENKKLKSDEKLASQPEPVVLRQTKLDLEAVKKALTDLKETKQYVSNLAEAGGKYIDKCTLGKDVSQDYDPLKNYFSALVGRSA